MHTCLRGTIHGYILMYACLKQFHAYILHVYKVDSTFKQTWCFEVTFDHNLLLTFSS